MASATENIEMDGQQSIITKDPVLFQVWLDGSLINERIEKLQPYSYAFGTPVEELKNCFNLTLAALGLVDPSQYYLGACSDRPIGSSLSEISEYIRDSLLKCSLPTYVEFFFISPTHFKDRYLPELKNNYATILLLRFDNGEGHVMMLYKNELGLAFLVDPQLKLPNGRYPLTVTGGDAIQDFLITKAKEVGGVASKAIIGKEQSIQGKCMSDISPIWVNTAKGGSKIRKRRLHK